MARDYSIPPKQYREKLYYIQNSERWYLAGFAVNGLPRWCSTSEWAGKFDKFEVLRTAAKLGVHFRTKLCV
jgi:hypothetical protein